MLLLVLAQLLRVQVVHGAAVVVAVALRQRRLLEGKNSMGALAECVHPESDPMELAYHVCAQRAVRRGSATI